MRARCFVSSRASFLGVGLFCCLGLLLFNAGCPTVPPEVCSVDADCDDGNACTTDTCSGGVCSHAPIANCPSGKAVLDLGLLSDDAIAALEVQSEITSISIDSPPVVEFSVTTANGTGITGIGALWEDDNRYVRFTLTKLVPGSNGDPSVRVSYTRDTTNDGNTPPDYDTGSLVDNGDGTYTFTFNTDVANVTGVPYEPNLSHRVAGQIGSGSIPLEPQNLFLDFVPAGGAVTDTRNIVTVDSCNECHGGLVFHGRRFITEYCVNCHNPDLAEGEGDFKYMIHHLHSAQKFDVLDDGVDFSEVTYPQDLNNCRKCHNGEDAATADGDNWKNVPNMVACGACHSHVNFATGEGHLGGPQATNAACAGCHPASAIENHHVSANATPNNPNLPAGQRAITYTIDEVTASAGGVATVDFHIDSDGTPLDLTNLPADLAGPGRWPGFLLAWAEPQDGIDSPADYNNLGRTAAQPVSVSLEDLADGSAGSLACDAAGCTAVLTGNPFPAGATMRAVGLQGYFQQDVSGETVSLHTLSAVMGVSGDDVRREVVDPNKCGGCHEWFEGHGGNRVIGIRLASQEPQQPLVCAMCHNPNLTSSGRSIDPADAADRDGDPMTNDPSSATVDLGTSNTWTWPEDSNNLKDMIHGIHAAAVRTFDYEFVRGRNDGIYYNWSEVTFPAEDGVRNCLMCHLEGTYELPLDDNVLETTVRTTGTDDGLDNNDFAEVGMARGNVPNPTDWVNTPTASTCYMCHHNSEIAVAHMRQNGGIISVADPNAADYTQRQEVDTVESCAVCHGPGKVVDISVVHELD